MTRPDRLSTSTLARFQRAAAVSLAWLLAVSAGASMPAGQLVAASESASMDSIGSFEGSLLPIHGVGDLEATYSSLGVTLNDIVGLAFQDDSGGTHLYVLDGGGDRIHRYVVAPGSFTLTHDRSVALPAGLASPRGLAYAFEDGADILYFNDWQEDGASRVYRFDFDTRDIPLPLTLINYTSLLRRLHR